ncbi:hypothetical protein ABMY26_06780 (plasmid) [Azospirillum sp. HJ39]|uniref:hypothetical protein n=1 Tax=Azospirillum sp. HJ39 TaxID=3159496 RepID=UPI0035591063
MAHVDPGDVSYRTLWIAAAALIPLSTGLYGVSAQIPWLVLVSLATFGAAVVTFVLSSKRDSKVKKENEEDLVASEPDKGPQGARPDSPTLQNLRVAKANSDNPTKSNALPLALLPVGLSILPATTGVSGFMLGAFTYTANLNISRITSNARTPRSKNRVARIRVNFARSQVVISGLREVGFKLDDKINVSEPYKQNIIKVTNHSFGKWPKSGHRKDHHKFTISAKKVVHD